MLRNNKEREEWLKRELDNKNNILLTDSGIRLIRVQINEGVEKALMETEEDDDEAFKN